MRVDTTTQAKFDRSTLLELIPRRGTVPIVSIHQEESLETTVNYLAVFAALSEPLRVRIMCLLAQSETGEVPNTLLDERLPVGKSTISYHVGILKRAGLLSVRKSGRNYFYLLRPEHLERYSPGFLEHLRAADESSVAA